MDHTKIVSQSQSHIHVQSKIDDFFSRFKIATLMHRCGIRKHHGHSVRSLTEAIFTLPFVGKNFFRGIVLNSELPFGKDAAYDLLKGKDLTGVAFCFLWANGCMVFLIGLPAMIEYPCSSSMTAPMTDPDPSGWSCSPGFGF